MCPPTDPITTAGPGHIGPRHSRAPGRRAGGLAGALRWVACGVSALVPSVAALGQASAATDQALSEGERRLSAYLEQLGLHEVAAADLRARLERADASTKPALARALADLYVQMLAHADTPEQRQRLETLGRQLAAQLPDEQAGDLRLALVRARYQWAKGVAERARLGVLRPDEVQEAQAALRSLVAELESVAQQAGDQADRLERRRTGAGLDDQEQQRLEEALRVRSMARYMLGWSRYYQALLADAPRLAAQALVDLGVLLGAEPNRPATVEALDERMLRFEHVADSAIAAAMCEAMIGNTDTALRWLDKIASAPSVPEPVTDRLPAVRLLVLGQGGRWRDLAYHSDRLRRARIARGHAGLEPLQAHLLAVIAWQALADASLPPRDRSVLEEVAHGAIQDLVRQDQVAILRSLVERFGTASLQGEGFIFALVRGQNAYQRATEADQARRRADASDDDATPPDAAADDAVANLYAQAVRALDAAVQSPDAHRYPDERAQAMLLAAMSAYQSGQLLDAADRFEAVLHAATNDRLAEDALWHAIVALDRAIAQGHQGLESRRDRLVQAFMDRFPQTERAARLLVARAGAAASGDTRAIDVLLAVPEGSPLYESARRRAERLLYERLRSLRGDARSAAAMRYLALAEELLALDRRRAAGQDDQAQRAAERALAQSRAMLEVIFNSPVPDARRASALVELAEELARRVPQPPDGLGQELAFRRVQLALADRQPERARRLAEAIDPDAGPYRALAMRAIYVWSAQRMDEQPEDPSHARRVVEAGRSVIAQLGDQPLAQRQVLGVHATVARAAWRLWRGDPQGPQARADLDLMLAIDARLAEADLADAYALMRLGYGLEAVERPGEALEAWRRLLAGATAGTPMALRARYESARLLARQDPQRALEALRQHELLEPTSHEPWASRLADLRKALEHGGPLPPWTLEDAP
ncbi:MAG: hypothetical protein KatS3mg103_0766 [Phycisphaerales bacterium]|nr:MAG: hypothetical protein KatS3mg103_0766 [Phycisphaerales bacterium]